VQVALNIVNQRAVPLLARFSAAGYGVIARMPYQFGLLTGRVTRDTRFDPGDHRAVRLAPPLLETVLPVLEREVWPIADRAGLSRAALALAFCASFPEVSTVIPGIRTPAQAEASAAAPLRLPQRERKRLRQLFDEGPLAAALEAMQGQG
jgi:aryl-alcohol dehydrogenase-like predicted oxidoreductase